MNIAELHNWQEVALAFIAALPAVIAAASSLRNGREQKRVKRELQETNGRIQKMSLYTNGRS